MKFDRSNKFDFCYYGQVIRYGWNRVYLRNGQVIISGGNIYFAGDGTYEAHIFCIIFVLFQNMARMQLEDSHSCKLSSTDISLQWLLTMME